MNKKICILTILILCIVLMFQTYSFADTDEFSNLTMNIQISENGTAYVTEIWNVKIYEGTEMYKPYYDLEDSEIRNFSVKDETGKEYALLSNWNVNATRENKKEKCGINEVDDGIELCWGIGDYGEHTYTISYEITNFVTAYQNYQMTYFTLVQKNMDPIPEEVTITIRSDSEFSSSNVAIEKERI